MPNLLQLSAPTIDDLRQKVRDEHGPLARIVSAEKVIPRGIGRIRKPTYFEAVVELPDEPVSPPEVRVNPAARSGIAALLADAEDAEAVLELHEVRACDDCAGSAAGSSAGSAAGGHVGCGRRRGRQRRRQCAGGQRAVRPAVRGRGADGPTVAACDRIPILRRVRRADGEPRRFRSICHTAGGSRSPLRRPARVGGRASAAPRSGTAPRARRPRRRREPRTGCARQSLR